jgi:LmbE family N-acetylglucosaminyl deacetylase
MHILGKRLLIVTAHPDDESFLVAGTMLKNHAARGKNFVFCATHGERGRAHFKKPPTDAALKRIRTKELERVSKCLGVDRLALGKLPDGELSKPKYKAVFRTKLAKFASRVKPNIVVGFGRDGISGHKDHIAACEIAEMFAKKARLPYLAFCMPPKLQEYRHWLKKRRKHGVYAKNNHHIESPNIVYMINGKKKLAALRMHKSQLKDGDPFWGLPRSVAKAHLHAEYFALRSYSIQQTKISSTYPRRT